MPTAEPTTRRIARAVLVASCAAAAACLQVNDDGLNRGGGDGCEYCHADLDQLGAHAVHVHGAGDYGAVYACTECHPVTAEAFTDADPGLVHDPLGVGFGQSALAAADGAAPAFDSGSSRCAGVYCHGATLGGGDGTGPEWTGGDAIACGDCHGRPPPSPHPDEDDDCGDCHGETMSGDWPGGDTHVDGEIQFGEEEDDEARGNRP